MGEGRGEIAPGQGVGAGENPPERSVGDDPAAVHPRPGAEVDDVLGAADGLLVVLDHHHRVALLAERAQGIEQHRVVAGVQPDGRLVEDVAHAAQVRAELHGEPDALRLAAREGGGGAVEPQVSETDLAEEVEPGYELREHVVGDRRLPPARPDPGQDAARGPDVESAEVRDAARAVAHRERLRAQPPAGAGAALARRLVVPGLRPVRHQRLPEGQRHGFNLCPALRWGGCAGSEDRLQAACLSRAPITRRACAGSPPSS